MVIKVGKSINVERFNYGNIRFLLSLFYIILIVLSSIRGVFKKYKEIIFFQYKY